MKKPTTISKESVSEYREFVQLRLRKRVLEAIEVVLEEEVDQALGCRSYERAEDQDNDCRMFRTRPSAQVLGSKVVPLGCPRKFSEPSRLGSAGFVLRYKERKRERFLTEEGYRRPDRFLDEAEENGPVRRHPSQRFTC